MPASTDIQVPRISPGHRVIWLYSRKRSFLLGYGVQRVPAEVVRIWKHRIRQGKLTGIRKTGECPPR